MAYFDRVRPLGSPLVAADSLSFALLTAVVPAATAGVVAVVPAATAGVVAVVPAVTAGVVAVVPAVTAGVVAVVPAATAGAGVALCALFAVVAALRSCGFGLMSPFINLTGPNSTTDQNPAKKSGSRLKQIY